jgi:O-antigen/teichoic acid export membrane protein
MLKERIDASELAALAFKLMLAASLGVAVFGAWHSEEVMGLLYREHVAEASPVFALLMWCFVAVCTTYVFGTLLTAAGSLRWLNWMAAGGVLIPRMQAEGAAWAALITQVLTAIVQLLLAVRAQRLNGILPIALRGAAHGALLVGLAWLIGRSDAALPWAALLFGLAALASAWATGLLRPGELQGALNEGR